MNFLLHMIGQAHRETSGDFERPSGRQTLLRRAAVAATEGRFGDAVTLRQHLDNRSPRSSTQTFILAHLHLCAGDFAAACDAFEQGLGLDADFDNAERSPRFSKALDRLLEEQLDHAAHDSAEAPLERQIELADAHLRSGRYIPATAQLQQARNTLDTQLSAHAGLLVATTRLHHNVIPSPESAAPLLALAKLGDLLLRMLARTHLVAHVARSLRDRDLREDLAPWATTRRNVDHLLQAEFDVLQRTCDTHPDHAENNYRLGLLARALNQHEAAAQAFRRVVTIHPHHVLAAARLAATLLELGRPDAAMLVLVLAFTLPAQSVAQYHQLAIAARDRRTFEKTVTNLCDRLPSPAARATTKATLAFALGEMGLLDEERSTWTNPAPIAQTIQPL
jgi:tetratricopeptide (TPR) repeat protein